MCIRDSFRTPFDYPDELDQRRVRNGSMDNNSLLDGKGFVEKVDTFSGLYRITRVTSEFSQGQFSQTLEMLRMPNQSLTDDEADTFIENLKKEPVGPPAPGEGMAT